MKEREKHNKEYDHFVNTLIFQVIRKILHLTMFYLLSNKMSFRKWRYNYYSKENTCHVVEYLVPHKFEL